MVDSDSSSSDEEVTHVCNNISAQQKSKRLRTSDETNDNEGSSPKHKKSCHPQSNALRLSKVNAPSAKKSKQQVASMDTKEFTNHVRNKANNTLERFIAKKNRLNDLDMAVKTTRALISSNQEIWQRCVDSGCGPEGDKLVFKRVGFTEIQVKTTRKDLSFEAVPKFTKTDFGVPKPFPKELSSIIAPTLAPGEIFQDYEKYLETILLLNDDTQLAFLCILKKHLEDIQIFLGEIDSWLMAGSFCIDFIIENFKTSRRALELSEEMTHCDSFCMENHVGLSCLRCDHTVWQGYTLPRCTGLSGHHSYFHARAVVVKQCKTDGEHNHSFDITQEAQQDKLKKFLEFVE